MLFLFTLLACEPIELSVTEKVNINDPNQTENNTNEPEDVEVVEPSTDDECAEDEGSATADPNSLIGRPDCGEIVYFSRCSICHGENGEGGNAGRRLQGEIDDMTDSYIMESILGGQGTMPPQNLTAQETADVLSYLREVM